MSNHHRVLPLCMLAMCVACAASEQPQADDGDAVLSAEQADETRVEAVIAAPMSGDTIAESFTLMLETRNLTLRPAGTVETGTGHHHLFIDRDIVAEGTVIPAERGVVHLGAAQSEHTFEDLTSGAHIIVAVLGDHEHRRIVDAKTDTVQVVIRN